MLYSVFFFFWTVVSQTGQVDESEWLAIVYIFMAFHSLFSLSIFPVVPILLEQLQMCTSLYFFWDCAQFLGAQTTTGRE